jgi:hypothetical protein
MRLRIASINDATIKESDRKFHWPLGRRNDDHPSLSDLGLRCHGQHVCPSKRRGLYTKRKAGPNA